MNPLSTCYQIGSTGIGNPMVAVSSPPPWPISISSQQRNAVLGTTIMQWPWGAPVPQKFHKTTSRFLELPRPYRLVNWQVLNLQSPASRTRNLQDPWILHYLYTKSCPTSALSFGMLRVRLVSVAAHIDTTSPDSQYIWARPRWHW
jgi:hypothetical protein